MKIDAEPAATVAIPAEWTALVKQDPQRARDEQARARAEFKKAFEQGLVCAGFEREPNNRVTSYSIETKSHNDVHQVRSLRRSSRAQFYRAFAEPLPYAFGRCAWHRHARNCRAVEQSMQRVGMGTRSFRVGSGYPILYGECGSGPKRLLSTGITMCSR